MARLNIAMWWQLSIEYIMNRSRNQRKWSFNTGACSAMHCSWLCTVARIKPLCTVAFVPPRWHKIAMPLAQNCHYDGTVVPPRWHKTLEGYKKQTRGCAVFDAPSCCSNFHSLRRDEKQFFFLPKVPVYRMPCAIMALATFINPATLAPFT